MVLETGYIRGADLGHLATALYISPEPHRMSFITFDQQQKTRATQLGFRT